MKLFSTLALALGFGAAQAVTIDAVYFAQTHVQEPTHPYFYLVGNRDALIKAHVVAPGSPASPRVNAILTLDGQTLGLSLAGPAVLPATISNGPGVVQHSDANSFTAMIPKAWVKAGLAVAVTAGTERFDFNNLKIGAPTKVVMTMFDVQYFADTNSDYPAGWKEELEAKWPVVELEARRIPHVVFPELVIPPRAGVPAARVKSKADYTAQTGLGFDGEQAAALAWNGALKAAAGKSGRVSLYFTNISDYSEFKMRSYLEGHVLVWNAALGKYASWNQSARAYTSTVSNNGVAYPVQRDVPVISVMASISGSNPSVNMVYPPIGPFSGGLIKLFDPTVAAERTEARSIFSPSGGSDLCLRITQGGVQKTYMLAASWETSADPLSGGAPATAHDQIAVTGLLVIGNGVLGFSDFVFNDLGGLQEGAYPLITSSEINPGDSLDPADLSGVVGSLTGTLRISGDGRDLELVIGDYGIWAARFPGLDLSDPQADLDGDGLSNDRERIWGLDPASAAASNPVTPSPNLAAGVFSYTRRVPELTGFSYTVWTSPDLATWTEDTGAAQTPDSPVNDVETVSVALSPTLLAGPRLFVRVRAAN